MDTGQFLGDQMSGAAGSAPLHLNFSYPTVSPVHLNPQLGSTKKSGKAGDVLAVVGFNVVTETSFFLRQRAESLREDTGNSNVS
jgi:hypothetical protein